MERIRVDTDKLKDHSKVFESSAEVFAQAGKDILNFAATLPSYDGQLSTPARAAALEINRQCQELSACLSSDAQSLAKTAKAFEDVDQETINAFDGFKNGLADVHPGKDIIQTYQYKYWDDVTKSWVTKITIIVIHPDYFTDQIDITITDNTVTNPDGSITHTKTLHSEKVVTGEDLYNFYKKQSQIGAFGDLLSGSWEILIGELIASTGFGLIFDGFCLGLAYLISSTDFQHAPFHPGDVLQTTIVEKETTFPDGSKSVSKTQTTEIVSKGVVIAREINKKEIHINADGSSTEITSVIVETYYPVEEGGGIKSREVWEVDETHDNGVHTITSKHSVEEWRPDGTITKKFEDPTNTHTELEE